MRYNFEEYDNEEGFEIQEQEMELIQEIPSLRQNVISARQLKEESNRSFYNSSLQSANGRNMSKYIIKEFFSLIQQREFKEDHWAKLMEIKDKAQDTGNTTHLKELFGVKEDPREEEMNKINREIAQEKIAKYILKEVMMNNSIKDPVNYICTCYCYMYRLNYPETAESGVALVRKSKGKK